MIILTIAMISGFIAMNIVIFNLRNKIGILKDEVSKKSNLHFDVQRAQREGSIDYSNLKNRIDEIEIINKNFTNSNLQTNHAISLKVEEIEKNCTGLKNMFIESHDNIEISIFKLNNIINEIGDRLKNRDEHEHQLKLAICEVMEFKKNTQGNLKESDKEFNLLKRKVGGHSLDILKMKKIVLPKPIKEKKAKKIKEEKINEE